MILERNTRRERERESERERRVAKCVIKKAGSLEAEHDSSLNEIGPQREQGIKAQAGTHTPHTYSRNW